MSSTSRLVAIARSVPCGECYITAQHSCVQTIASPRIVGRASMTVMAVANYSYRVSSPFSSLLSQFTGARSTHGMLLFKTASAASAPRCVSVHFQTLDHAHWPLATDTCSCLQGLGLDSNSRTSTAAQPSASSHAILFQDWSTCSQHMFSWLAPSGPSITPSFSMHAGVPTVKAQKIATAVSCCHTKSQFGGQHRTNTLHG